MERSNASGSLWEKYDPTYAAFRDLMPFRIREVLLVSSQYDSYILEEDGRLAESLDAEFLDFRLSHAPHIIQVSTGESARQVLATRPIDLVISMTRLGDMDVLRFGRSLKEKWPNLPLVLLADSPASANRVKEQNVGHTFDQVFVWRGDTTLFLAIIKYIEDRENVENDTRHAGVRTIILIENSVRFYSTYLPFLYAELMKQTQALIGDVANARQRLRRLKARPKILLAETYEDGWALYERYRTFTLGIISDARFARGGSIEPEAGLEFVQRVKQADPDMPALIQSYDAELAPKAHALGAAVDDDFGSRGKRLSGQAAPQERVGRAAFDHPPLHRAVGLLDVDVNPGVRVDPFHFDDGALQLDGLVGIELGRERVMRRDRQCERHP
jgi:CheY-like chemotaxis protein